MRKSKVGSMNDRVTIQAAVLTPDGAGGNTEQWMDALTVWAEVTVGSSRTTFDRLGTQIYSDLRFRVRSGTGVGKRNRIIYENRMCVIDGITDHLDREFQIIHVSYSEGGASVSGGGGTGPTSGLLGKYLEVQAGSQIIDVALSGKYLVNVYRNGIAPEIITTGAPTGSQVLWDSSSGTFTFGAELADDEYVYAIYY